MTDLIYHHVTSKELRNVLEQYLIALMANIDYHHYSSDFQVVDELTKTHKDFKSFVAYILTAVPKHLSDNKLEILNQRVNTLEELSSKFKIISSSIYLNDETLKRNLNKSNNPKLTLLNVVNPDKFSQNRKITSHNIDDILRGWKDNGYNNNLIIITSTFAIYKTALEVEKWFFKQEDITPPDVILIIGDKKIFDTLPIKKPSIEAANLDEKLKTGEMKAFLFEILLHCLDRNSFS